MITGESGKARDDVLAALARRGWAGRLVWGFAPVQDRHAAPAIVPGAGGSRWRWRRWRWSIVARGGGSLADLLCFCDETLCRTVALLGVPGDRLGRPPHRPHAARRRRRGELLDADPRRRGRRRRRLRRARARAGGRRSAPARPRPPGRPLRARACWRRSRAPPPRTWSASARACTSSCARSARPGAGASSHERRLTRQRALVLERKTDSSLLDCRRRRPRELERLALALAGHDPQRTLERGYVLVQSADGEPLVERRRRPAARRARSPALRRGDASGRGSSSADDAAARG